MDVIVVSIIPKDDTIFVVLQPNRKKLLIKLNEYYQEVKYKSTGSILESMNSKIERF